MKSTDDLIAFLRARLKDRAAKLRRLIASESPDEFLDEEELNGGRDWWGEFGEVLTEVADLHQMLAEVDAKRQIIELHKLGYPGDGTPQYGKHWESYNVYNDDGSIRGDREYCVENDEPMPPYHCRTCGENDFCKTLRLLALPYAGHEDYREGWKP